MTWKCLCEMAKLQFGKASKLWNWHMSSTFNFGNIGVDQLTKTKPWNCNMQMMYKYMYIWAFIAKWNAANCRSTLYNLRGDHMTLLVVWTGLPFSNMCTPLSSDLLGLWDFVSIKVLFWCTYQLKEHYYSIHWFFASGICISMCYFSTVASAWLFCGKDQQ